MTKNNVQFKSRSHKITQLQMGLEIALFLKLKYFKYTTLV